MMQIKNTLTSFPLALLCPPYPLLFNIDGGEDLNPPFLPASLWLGKDHITASYHSVIYIEYRPYYCPTSPATPTVHTNTCSLRPDISV